MENINKPQVIEIKKGESKAFCLCGLSKNGSFCDGSHATSGKKPHIITAQEDQRVYICACKKSAQLPFCDGSHKN